MTDLERALAEIGAIHSQLAQGSRFHGLGPTAFTATGVLAMAAALPTVALDRPIPQVHVVAFLSPWITVAAVSAGVIGFEMIFRSRRMHSQLADEMIVASVGQFLLGGAPRRRCSPRVLIWFTPQNGLDAAGALRGRSPGLPGVFASCRFLPRWMAIVGAWYVACGLAGLAFAQGPLALSAPWSMGVPFGLGQMLVAAVLRFAGETDE